MSEEIRIPVSADTSPMERDISNVASKMRVSIRADLDSKQLEAFSKPLGRITGQADEFSKSMDAANARVLAFGASVGVVNALSNALKSLVSSSIEVEQSLKNISIIGGSSFKNLESVSRGLFQMSKELGVSYKDASTATLEFARQGKNLQDSLAASRSALALTRISGIDAAEAVSGLTSAVNAFGRGADAYIEYTNKMSSVSDAFAVNNKDLIEGISRSASVAQEAGVSFDQLTALITTLQEKTGRGGAVIGNALKTIFTRVQNPEILKDIKDLGIAVEDVSTGNFLPATTIIQNLANQFNTLDGNVRKNLLLKVGGGFQIDKLAAALNDMAEANGTFQRSLQVSSNNAGNILGKVSEMNQTVESAFSIASSSAKELGSTIGRIAFTDDFRKILENSSQLFDGITKAISGSNDEEGGASIGSGIAKGIVKGIGSVISGPGLFLFAGILTKLTADFAKFSVSGIQTLIGINSKSKEEESIQKSITNVLSNNADLQLKLFNLEGNKTAQAQLLLNKYVEVAAQMEKISKLSQTLTKPLYEGGVRLATGGLEIKNAKTAAAGYVPNLSTAISSEKSQAPAGSKIIVDHNFPMGGGERGTMVYNSNETRIRNFANSGGDAIIPNYPVNAAAGYTPNFADAKTEEEKKKTKAKETKYAIGGKGELDIDAGKVPLAGITLAGKDSYLARAKGKEITDDLLKDYVGSPFFDKLREYDKIVVTNVPVGSVYRFRQGLSEKEDSIKQDFVTRVNQKVRPSILEFVDSEVKSLGLKPGAGLKGSLDNLRTDLIGPSTAGYILEEILKVPTLTNAEKLAQYAAQSEKSYFDLQDLDPESAEAFGLPKKAFAYADIKLGQKELHRTLTEKFLNQAIYEGGGTKLKNAAKGYIPNFSKNISEYSKNKSGGLLNNFYDVNNTQSGKLFNDKVSGSVNIIEKPLFKTAIEYRGEASEVLNSINKNVESIKPKDQKEQQKQKEITLFKRKYSKYLSSSFKYENLFSKDEDSIKGTLSNIQGAIAEKEVAKQNPTYEYRGGNFPVDFIDQSGTAVEVKARKRKFSQKEADSKILSLLGQQSIHKNFRDETIDLSKENIILHEAVKNSASGYVPNFAKTTADILTVNPLIGMSSLDDYVQKYITSNAGTGLTGTFGFNEQAEQLGPNLSPEAKNDFLMSMLGINWLATFNRDKQADQARSSLINTKAGSSRWTRYQKGINTPSIQTEGGMKMVADKSNVIEGLFSGETKELKYEDLYKHADQIFSKTGVSDIFNNDIVANMHAAAMKYHKGEGYEYGPRTQEYQKIKAATAMLRPILTQGLIGEDKNVQAFLVNPPEQDKEVVGEQSKYLTLIDPKAAKLKKYLSDYLINPEREPLEEGSGEAEKNISKLKTTRQILESYFPNSYSSVPIPLDILKEARSSTYTNPQLRNFFSEGSGSAFSSVEMARNSTTKKPTGIKAFWNRELKDSQVENIKQVLSASIGRGGIFPIDNLDFNYNGPSTKTPSADELVTFRNSIDLPLRAPSVLPKSLPYGRYKESKQAYDEQAKFENLKYKYNKDTKGVDLVALNAAKGYVPNFVSESGMNAMKKIAEGNTPEAEVARTKLAQLNGGINFETLKSKSGSSSYVSRLQDKILASVDFSDFGSEIALDSANGDLENLQKLLKQFAVVNKGRNISYPSYSENASVVKSILKLKNGVNLQEGDFVGTAGKGYVPNFSELTGSGSGMLYSDPNYNQLGAGTTGKFLAPKSGEGFGQKIFYKNDSEKAKQEYQVNKSIKEFEKKNPSIFAKNAVSFTEVGNVLTKNGLIAGFQREVIPDIGVDEFSTKSFPGSVNPMGDYAFGLSELMAQAGVKNVVNEYKKTTNDTSFRIDDVYAQNFKVNSLMQKALMDETKKRFSTKNKPNQDQVFAEIESLAGSSVPSSLNEKYGPLGARHAMFDTAGFSQDAIKTAAKGYIPNFADSVEKAVIREKMATGLPDSMIKVSNDKRAYHPTLNPTATIVTNKIDEPRGASDVSNTRMINAYSNAAKGYTPNFADNLAADAAMRERLDMPKLGIDAAAIKSTETSTKAVSDANQKLVDKILDYILTLSNDQRVQGVLISNLEAYSKEINTAKELQSELIQKISKDLSLATKGTTSREEIAKKIESFNPSSEPTTPRERNSNTEKTTNGPVNSVAKTEVDKDKVDGKNLKQTEKSFADIAAKVFVFQSALSLTSGFLSTFGENANKVGESLNDLGQAAIAASQVGDIKTQLIGKKTEGETGLLAGGGGLRSALGMATGIAGGVFVAVQAIGALDKAIQVLNGTTSKSKNFIDDLDASFTNYNVQLTTQQKKIADSISKNIGVSGAGFGGALNRAGLNYESIFGDKDIAKLRSLMGTTGLNDSGNTGLAQRAAELLVPQANQSLIEGGNKKPKSAEIEALATKTFSDKLEEFKSKATYTVTQQDPNKRLLEDKKAQLNQQLNKKYGEPDENLKIKLTKEINELTKQGAATAKDKVKIVFDEKIYLESIKKYLEDQIIPTENAKLAEQERTDALLSSTNLLKTQLGTIQELSKIQLSIPSALENQLSIEKELLTTSESRRMGLDYELKSLSEQRQTLSEIKDTALSFGKEKINNYLNIAGQSLSVRGNTKEDILSGFTKIASSSTQGEAVKNTELLIEKLKVIKTEGKESDEAKKSRQEIINGLESQLVVVKANSAARQVQNAIEAQNASYLKQQNNEYNIRKEAITTQLALEQKSVELQKQKLDLIRQSSDIEFQTGQIGKAPTLSAIAEAQRGLQLSKERPQQDLKIQQQQFDIAKKQSTTEFLFSKNIRPERVEEILNKPQKEQIKEITIELNKQQTELSDRVKESADIFLDKISQAAVLISDKLNPNQSLEESLRGIPLENFGPQRLQLYKSQLQSKSEPNFTSTNEPPFYTDKNSDLINKLDEAIIKATKKEYAPTIFQENTVANQLEGRGPNAIAAQEQKKRDDANIILAEKKYQEALKKTTFKGGMEEVNTQLTEDIVTFQNTLGKTIPMSFRDGMVSAMKELSNPNSTEPLKIRLLGVAKSFLDKINEAFMTNAANKVTSSLTGFLGGAEGKAAGGPIMGGSGVRDDVPAMLMGGEYVVTKSAAQKYGPSFLDALNKGTIKKFADGGWVESNPTVYKDPNSTVPYGQKRDQGLSFDASGSVIGMDSYTGIAENKQDALKKAQTNYYAQNAQSGQGGFYMPGENGAGAIMGQRSLLSFATQQTAGTQFDKFSSGKNMAGVSLGAGSSNMSLFALRDQGNTKNASYLESQQKSFDLYLSGIEAAKEKATKEEDIRKEQEKIREEARTKERQAYQSIIRSIATSVVMAGVSAAASSAATGFSNASKAGELIGKPATFSDKLSGAWSGVGGQGGLSNMFSSAGYQNINQLTNSSGNTSILAKNGPMSLSSSNEAFSKYNPNGVSYGSADRSGNVFGSSVKTGQSSFNYSWLKKASGGSIAGNGMGDNVPTMLNGGEFVISKQATQNIGVNKLQQINSGAKTGDMSEALAAKLDQLVEKLSAVGTLNITVNSDSNGKQSEKQDGGNQDQKTKEMARRIKEVVMNVLKEEKRLGGMLR